MEVMAELVSDFKVERYNKHYFPETYDFVEEKGNPVLPDLTYLNNETWTYECVVTPKEETKNIPAPQTIQFGEEVLGYDKDGNLVLAESTDEAPGTIIRKDKKNLWIACGKQTVLAINELQPAGKGKQAVHDFLNGSGQQVQIGQQVK